MRARDVLDEGGLLARTASGFERRDSQLRMADIVERALEGDGVSLIEAGTGTGKTLGYLVPAVLSGRRIVISTGTRTLQDQIVETEIPRLSRALGEPIAAVALKGLSNYLCLRRLEELERSSEADARAEIAGALVSIRRWKDSTTSGDRGELAELPEDHPIWALVGSGTETRIGPRCRFHEACFVTAARERARAAQIVVVNHHLFFADLALRAQGASVIPDYEAAIFDEAHQIEDIATGFFGVSLSSARLETLARDIERALAAARIDDATVRGLLRTVLLRAADVIDRAPRAGDGSRAPIAESTRGAGLRDALFALDLDLEALGTALRVHVASESVTQLVRRIEATRSAASVLAEPGHGHVSWVEQRGRSVVLGASPVDVSALFRDQVLHRVKSVIFTSATLATGGSFEFARQRLGIDFEVDEEILASPFDYPRHSALYLPELVDPRAEGFTRVAAIEIQQLIDLTGGGAFVLCTSVRVMQELARMVRPHLMRRGLLTMVQGEAPKQALLDRFRSDGHAVLFATQSFWEGVDVPGDALRLVVIDRVPFEVPSDPLVQARCRKITEAGGNAFMEYVVPAAALALKQGFGRLIRTRGDRGIVAILDSRVRKKGYGKVLERSLPEAARFTRIEEVRAWHGSARDCDDPAGP